MVDRTRDLYENRPSSMVYTANANEVEVRNVS